MLKFFRNSCTTSFTNELPRRSYWKALRFFLMSAAMFRRGAELCETLVQLVGQLYKLADRGHRSARPLRGLARNVGDDLHSVCNAFRPAHLLFGCQRNFLYEFGRLAHHVGDGIEGAAGLIGEGCTAFHFLGAFFHYEHSFVGLCFYFLCLCCDILCW